MTARRLPHLVPIRVALRLAYDGGFDSYARQPGRRTVEGELLRALAGEGLVEGSFRTGSRTDAGVAALENVACATLGRPHLRGLVPAVQSRLPDGVWLTGAAAVGPSFDPRKASWRQYRYLAPARGEDGTALRAACAAFVGTHDVSAFARLEAGRDPVRTVSSFTVRHVRAPALAWLFRVRGESFLWSQVRRMVAAALAVGAGEARPEEIEAALASRQAPPRLQGLAPAEGLLLERVRYPGLRWAGEAGRLPPKDAWRQALRAQADAAVAAHALRLARGRRGPT